MNIYEVLEYGPIVAKDEDLGVLITANCSYLNFWVKKTKDTWENTDVRSFDLNITEKFEYPYGIMSLSMREVVRRAEEWLEECMKERFKD